MGADSALGVIVESCNCLNRVIRQGVVLELISEVIWGLVQRLYVE